MVLVECTALIICPEGVQAAARTPLDVLRNISKISEQQVSAAACMHSSKSILASLSYTSGQPIPAAHHQTASSSQQRL